MSEGSCRRCGDIARGHAGWRLFAPRSEFVERKRQLANFLAGGSKHSVRQHRRKRRQPSFTNSSPRTTPPAHRRDQIDIDFRHLLNTQELLCIEIGLDHSAVLDHHLPVERRGQALGYAALDLLYQHVGMHAVLGSTAHLTRCTRTGASGTEISATCAHQAPSPWTKAWNRPAGAIPHFACSAAASNVASALPASRSRCGNFAEKGFTKPAVLRIVDASPEADRYARFALRHANVRRWHTTGDL